LLAGILFFLSVPGVLIGLIGIEMQGDPDSGGFARHSLAFIGVPFLAGSIAMAALIIAWMGSGGRDGMVYAALGVAVSLLLEAAIYLSVAD
jgi:hypothetical protein